MESIYSMGTQAWRQWVTYWTEKSKSNSEDLIALDARVSELEDLVIALLPENAFITGDGSYLTTVDGKNLIITT